jgi:hypothetical protein
MPVTYESIATVTVGTAGTSFLVMDSIPATYTDLILIANGSAAATMQIRLRLNNISTASYSTTLLGGNGTSASSARTSTVGGATALPVDYFATFTTTSGGGVSVIQLMNYSNTTTEKTVLFRANTVGSGVTAGVGLFNSTNAITRIDVLSANGTTNISVGSTFTLYGIKSA